MSAPASSSADAPDAPAPKTARDRLAVLDVARGICILLVVLLHSQTMNISQVAADSMVGSLWDAIASATRPIRMPAFFLISGFLAHSSVYRPWRDVLEKRVVFIVYLYLLWVAIRQFAYFVMMWLKGTPTSAVSSIEHALSQLVLPSGVIWFLYALVFYFLLARLLRSWPLWASIGLALVASAFSEPLPEPMSYIARCAVFFLLGAYRPKVVTAIIARTSWRNIVIAGLAYGASVALVLKAGPLTPGVWLPASAAGLVLLMFIAQKISEIGEGTFLRRLGALTLPIYVMHATIIGYLTAFLLGPGSPVIAVVRDHFVLLLLYPVALNVAVVCLSLLLHRLLIAVGLGWLFELPKPIKTWVRTLTAPPARLGGRGGDAA